MKPTIIIALAATLVGSALAQSQNPKEILTRIQQFENNSFKQAQAKHDTNYDAIEDQTHQKVREALSSVDPNRVNPKEAYEWAQLYAMIDDQKSVCALARLYLTTDPEPEAKFQAQMMLMRSCSALGDGALLKDTLASAKPVSFNDRYVLDIMAAGFIDTIAKKEGSAGAYALIDQFEQQLKQDDPSQDAKDRLSEQKASGFKMPGAPMTDDQRLKQLEGFAKQENQGIRLELVSERANLLDADGNHDQALAVLGDFAKEYPALLNPSLKVFGDAAPTFAVGKWLKGQPVDQLEKGKVYVIDFWGTKCGPCIQAMPHLKAISERYAGKAQFISVCIVRWSPTVPYPDNPEKRVDFVKDHTNVMVDEVVEDKLDGSMNTNWLKPTGQDSIPKLFIVDATGKIAWYGGPDMLELALDRCVNQANPKN